MLILFLGVGFGSFGVPSTAEKSSYLQTFRIFDFFAADEDEVEQLALEDNLRLEDNGVWKPASIFASATINVFEVEGVQVLFSDIDVSILSQDSKSKNQTIDQYVFEIEL